MDSDDEPLTLSALTLAALQEFKKEEEENVKKFIELKKRAEDEDQERKMTIHDFKEDWQLSQFWYNDSTAEILGKAILQDADENTVIAIASAPSVYAAIQKLPKSEVPTEHIYCLEFDRRFEVLAGKNFVYYDYNEPHNLPAQVLHKCHRILIDPPFLEGECQKKSAIAARNMLVEDLSQKTISGALQYRLITSTGERMGPVVKTNYPDTEITDFFPEHKNGLSNEFRCYATFESDYWKFIKS